MRGIKMTAFIMTGLIMASCGVNNPEKKEGAKKDNVAGAQRDSVTGNLDTDQVTATNSLALTSQALKSYLPAIKGYEQGDLTGEDTYTGKSGSRYYAYARQQYKKGNKELVVEIIDYNNDRKTLNGLLNMYGFITPVNNEQIQTRLMDTGIPHVKALETTFKTEKNIRLTLAVADRFLIHIHEPGAYDAALLEQIAKNMRLQELIFSIAKK